MYVTIPIDFRYSYIQKRYKIEPIEWYLMEKTYQIQKLDITNYPIESEKTILFWTDPEYLDVTTKANSDYLTWDDFRKKDWTSKDREQKWWAVKLKRLTSNKPTSIKDKDGQYYKIDPSRHAQFLHEVTLELGGNMLGITSFTEGDKKQIIRRNLIEESIASSKLEGANTSRETARRMLREGRSPRDRSEKMIQNNHSTMLWIEEVGQYQKLSKEILLEVHRKVVSGTLGTPALEGSLRETLNANGKRLVIKPWDQFTIAYTAPDREFVKMQLPRFIAFANDEDGSAFIHPLIKAIMLHFWLGLLHPFEDGNGRLARILFYWYMLRHGYWAFSYLSLSERILKSPSEYAMSFINTEQDDYDLNYFVQYNIEKLKLARLHMLAYLKSKIKENKKLISVVETGHNLNTRQLRLLQYLHLGESTHVNVVEHHNVNPEIGYVSAVTDLKSLVEKNFLRKVKNGRNVIYLPTDKVQTLFR